MKTDHYIGDRRNQDEFRNWLKSRSGDFTHFITLATNDPTIGETAMRSRLRKWEARTFRALHGPKWHKHIDELPWSFSFIENPGSNPHWHILMRLMKRLDDNEKIETVLIRHSAERAWLKLASRGSVDVKRIEPGSNENVANYVAKQLGREIQFNSFVLPDEFWRFDIY